MQALLPTVRLCLWLLAMATLELVKASPVGISEQFHSSISIKDKIWERTPWEEVERQGQELVQSGYTCRSQDSQFTDRRGRTMLARTYIYTAPISAQTLKSDVTGLGEKFPTLFTKSVVSEIKDLAARYEAGDPSMSGVLGRNPTFKVTFRVTAPHTRRSKRWVVPAFRLAKKGLALYGAGTSLHGIGKSAYKYGKKAYNAGRRWVSRKPWRRLGR